MNRVQLEIVLGTVFVMLSTILLIFMATGETQRLEDYEVSQRAELIEFGAKIFENNCTRCHGDHAQGIAGVAPSLRSEHFFTQRIEEVGWQGSQEDYIISVVTVGRQVSTRPEFVGGGSPAMPTWSEKFGGPLRADEIRAVAAYIMNYQPEALGEVPVPEGLVDLSADSEDPVVRGRVVFVTAGCTACHTISGISDATVGPVLDGLADRAGDRIDGYTAEEYIHESIVDPNAYIVEGFTADVMPQTFSETLTEDQISDLIEFLMAETAE